MKKINFTKRYEIPVIAFLIILIIFTTLLLINIDKSEKEVKELTINRVRYVFNTNLYEAIRIPSSDDNKIKNIFEENNKICVKLDNSSQEDSAIFFVVSFNIVHKILTYYISNGVEKKIEVCNEKPNIELRGPNTGAKETSVKLINNTILVQGTTPKNLELAGDKLILIVLGIKEI